MAQVILIIAIVFTIFTIAFIQYQRVKERKRKYRLYIITQQQKKEQEKLEKQKQEKGQREKEERLKQKLLQKKLEKDNKTYELGTHRVKYPFFNSSKELSYEFDTIYKKIIVDSLWINEPFHTKFYQILLTFNNNDFMITDQNTKVISMTTRDRNNKEVQSKSYQVFSTNEIIVTTINKSLKGILNFNKKDAEDIVIAIFIYILELSNHYQKKEAVQKTIYQLLKNYEYKEDIFYIIDMIKDKKSNLLFVNKALESAFNCCKTYPYNDIETPKKLYQLPNSPKKYLLP